jgi:hypothetical protein
MPAIAAAARTAPRAADVILITAAAAVFAAGGLLAAAGAAGVTAGAVAGLRLGAGLRAGAVNGEVTGGGVNGRTWPESGDTVRVMALTPDACWRRGAEPAPEAGTLPRAPLTLAFPLSWLSDTWTPAPAAGAVPCRVPIITITAAISTTGAHFFQSRFLGFSCLFLGAFRQETVDTLRGFAPRESTLPSSIASSLRLFAVD